MEGRSGPSFTSRLRAAIRSFNTGTDATSPGQPVPPSYHVRDQGPFEVAGDASPWAPGAQVDGMGRGVHVDQLGDQMRQMQMQMLQMQQMMQQLMSPSAPAELPVGRPVIEVQARQSTASEKSSRASNTAPRNKGQATVGVVVPRGTLGAATVSSTVIAASLPSNKTVRVICSVCSITKKFVPFGQKGRSDFPGLNLTSECSHDPQVCLECLSSWIEVQLSSKGWDGICCPQCPQLLEHNIIQKFATPEVFQR